jgi:hypothetical protein
MGCRMANEEVEEFAVKVTEGHRGEGVEGTEARAWGGSAVNLEHGDELV